MKVIYDNTIKVNKIVKKYAKKFIKNITHSTTKCCECHSKLKLNIDDISYSFILGGFSFICPICKTHLNVNILYKVPLRYHEYKYRIRCKARDLLGKS